jgi:hypothetical protein
MKEAVCSYTKRGIDLISARQAQSNEIISLENRRVAEQILAVHLEGLAKKSLEDLFKKDPKTFIGCLADA